MGLSNNPTGVSEYNLTKKLKLPDKLEGEISKELKQMLTPAILHGASNYE